MDFMWYFVSDLKRIRSQVLAFRSCHGCLESLPRLQRLGGWSPCIEAIKGGCRPFIFSLLPQGEISAKWYTLSFWGVTLSLIHLVKSFLTAWWTSSSSSELHCGVFVLSHELRDPSFPLQWAFCPYSPGEPHHWCLVLPDQLHVFEAVDSCPLLSTFYFPR